MNIWVFQTGEPLPLDPGHQRPMRAINLCNKLIQAGHRVTLWSADFDHQQKQFRGKAGAQIQYVDNLDIILLPSPGYRKNIGLARLFDHAQLALNLRRRLAQLDDVPDVAFIGYPPIETAYVFGKWLNTRGVPFLLDIKDQWPTIFIQSLPRIVQPLGSLVFWPYHYLARSTMRRATGVSAMADGFLDWALTFCGKTRSENDAMIPLTTPSGEIEQIEVMAARQWWDHFGVAEGVGCRFSFVGSFSSAFDFLPVRLAAETALQQGDEIQFVLCGEGGDVGEVRAMMHGLPNVLFPGWIDRPKIEALAERCVASIAPYRNTPDFMLSIPNKIIDSLAMGLPVLSSLKGEVAAMIDNDGIGLKYNDAAGVGDESLYRTIVILRQDKNLQNTLSSNARELYNARFSFERVYGDLVVHLEHLAASSNRACAKHEIG